jgi:hypothetical protein
MMITQEKIFRFFETLSFKFLKENVPILNNLIHGYDGYPDMDDLEKNIPIPEEDENLLSDEEN